MTYPPSNKPFLDPATFKCTKCGQCCRPIVKVSEKDIQRIEEAGRKKEDFLDIAIPARDMFAALPVVMVQTGMLEKAKPGAPQTGEAQAGSQSTSTPL